MTDERPTRRQVVAGLGVTVIGGFTGCIGSLLEENSTTTEGACPKYDPIEPTTTDWRGEMGPPTNTGVVATEAVPEGELTVDWTVPVETHVGHHVPIVADGTAYVHDLDDDLSALDAVTGDQRWQRAITDPQTAPAVGDDVLVVTTREDTRALDAASGEELWTRSELGGGVFDAAPVIADGIVYVQRGVATHALTLATGETRWRVPTGLSSSSTPAITDETVYTAGDDTYVRALAVSDGTERWRVKTNARVRCNVAVADETVIIGTEAGDVLALDTDTGTERWRHHLAPRQSGDQSRPERPETIATDGSRVYVATGTTLVTLAIGDGTRCWRTRSYQGGYASGVAVGSGKVFAPTSGREVALTAFDASTGEVDRRLTGEGTYHFDIGPSLATGGLYLAGRDAVARFS